MTDLFQWNYDDGSRYPEYIRVAVRTPIAYEYPPLETGREWMDEAICRQVDPELFFPEGHTTGKAALSICQRCPVIEDCRANTLHEGYGIFGGLTAKQRRAIRKQREAS